jgi:hypothetical protein
VEASILENNLYGVDINDEATEIAKLSLWLRTARKGRKLNNLNQHIKCGNSLIDDPAVAGDKAFNWQEEFPQVFAKGGFDVVIGNPPYGASVSKEEKKYFNENYKTTLVNYDTYGLFFESAIKIQRNNALLGFITPNTFLVIENGVQLRTLLFKHNSIKSFLETPKVFQDAVVEPITTILQKSHPVDENKITSISIPRNNKLNDQEISSWKSIIFNQLNLIERSDLIFNYRATVRNIELAKKVKTNSIELKEVSKITAGVKPYEKGKGNPPQTNEILETKPYTGYNKTGEDWYKLIRGTQVNRYRLDWDYEFIKYGDSLAAPRNSKSFFLPKIFIRRTDDKILAVYDTDKFVGLNSVHCLQLLTDSINYKFLLVLLNSKVLNWYFQYENFHMVGKPLAEIKVVFVERLPIIISDDQLPFIAQADIMLSKNKELQQIKQQLLQLLQGKYPQLVLTKKLQDWPGISFNDFLKELDKQKIKLTLPEQSEWMQYVATEKARANAIQQLITQTDKAIDAMVYALYQLTPEEIQIVEGNA